MSTCVYRLSDAALLPAVQRGPRLRYVTEAEYSSEWYCSPHTHGCTELFFVTGGHGALQLEDKVFPIAVNDVVVINANVLHTETSQADDPLAYVVLGVDGLEVLSDIGGSTMLHLRGEQRGLKSCLTVMLQEARGQETGWETVCQTLLGVLLRRLDSREDFTLLEDRDSGGGKSNHECELVRRYIDNHFKENLCLDELASLAHINKYYLSHVFRKEFGTSPISYLISRRIQESRYLLRDTDHTLSQIAHILGFSSLSYFSQSFRHLEGVSPMEYRKRYRQAAGREGPTGYLPLSPKRPVTVEALYSVHYFEYSSCYSFAGESHGFWELLYVDKGALEVVAGEQKLHMTAGQIIFHPPGQFHALSAAEGTAPDLVVIGFACHSPELKAIGGKLMGVGSTHRTLMGRMVEESRLVFSSPLNDPATTALVRSPEAPFGGEQRVTAALEELLLQMIRKEQSGCALEERPAEGSDAQWLRDMENYMNAHLETALTLEQVCRDNLIGRSQLQKRFNQLTGGGAMAYYGRLKLQAARRLIREGELNMTQIAARLGYQSVHYFSRHFRQQMGMSPSQYANSVKMLSSLPGTPADERANNV